jgi:hypothetical protein
MTADLATFALMAVEAVGVLWIVRTRKGGTARPRA